MAIVIDHSAQSGAVSQIHDAVEEVALIEIARTRSPSFLEFRGASYKLLVGVAEHCGCAQFSELSGDPPYQMAIMLEPTVRCEHGTIEYNMNGSSTEISFPYNIPIPLITKLAEHFVQTERQWPMVGWDEV